ncbi:hypothetical protein M8C21_031399, partial [Ambrosia artemisiifolia]
RKVITMNKHIIDDALTNLYSAMNFPKTLIMADLGCSSGPNTLLVVSELNLTNQMVPNSSSRCYISGVPGSFYTRLFLSKSIHFVYSSYSLMWLSQVPKMINTNKGNIYMSTTSPPSVIKAYREQFQVDFLTFLKYRAEEMVSGGRMVLTILGRQSDDPCSKECCYVWDLLAKSLNEMVVEGLIEEEKLDSFNIPQYTPSPKEVSNKVEKEGSFVIDRLEVSEVNWDACTNDNLILSEEDVQGYNMGKCMRAVAEPLVLSHFGESIVEEVFARYTNNIKITMSIEKTKLVNVTVSMTLKG